MTHPDLHPSLEISTYTLPRTGMRPLRFRGEKLYSDTTRADDGPAEQRWWEVEIYRTLDGRYVVALHYQSQWLSELAAHRAEVVATLDEAIRLLETHDPLAPVVGFPPDRRYEARQQHLERTLRAAWQALVSRAAATLEVAEELTPRA